MGIKVDRIRDDDGSSIYINRKTGEAIEPESGVYYPNREIAAIKRKEAEKQCSEALFYPAINELYKDYGRFTWLIFRYCEQLLPDVSSSDLAKLLYLSTYIGYDGVISRGNHAVDTDDMRELMGIKRNAYSDFISRMTESRVIIFDGGKARISGDIVCRGKLPLKKTVDYIRLNHDGIRRLYADTAPSKHATLSYLFRLIPYVNCDHNILCINPREKDGEKIDAMTLTKCLKICGAGTNSAQKARDLFEMKYNGRLILRCLTDEFNSEAQFIIINPLIYYAGSNIDSNSSEFKAFFKQ